MKVIIAGGRDFSDYRLLKEKVDNILSRSDLSKVEIVSGTAKGADKLGEKYAIEKGLCVKRFAANWEKFGKGAGYRRNEEMADYATHCIVFWNGQSKGSKHMIDLAVKKGLKIRVINY